MTGIDLMLKEIKESGMVIDLIETGCPASVTHLLLSSTETSNSVSYSKIDNSPFTVDDILEVTGKNLIKLSGDIGKANTKVVSVFKIGKNRLVGAFGIEYKGVKTYYKIDHELTVHKNYSYRLIASNMIAQYGVKVLLLTLGQELQDMSFISEILDEDLNIITK